MALLDTALSIGGGLVGGALDSIFGGESAEERAQKYYQQALEEIKSTGVPAPEAMRIVLQRAKQEGQYTPALEQVITQGDSELKGIQEDPALRQAQLNSLQGLQDIVEGGGMTLADKANLEQQLGEARSAEKGSRDRIAQSMAERGTSNSGLALAMQLANQQSAAQLENQAALKTAGDAQVRALQALQGAGELGGQIRAQDFNQAAKIAAAQDAINNFNAANKQGVATRNTGAMNEGQQYNLKRGDMYSMYNTDIANQEEKHNKNLLQQDYDNRLRRASGAAGIAGSQAGAVRPDGPGFGTQAGAALGGLAASYFGKDDEEEKKNTGDQDSYFGSLA